MQTKTKRTEITSETATLLILRKTDNGLRLGRCQKCLAEVFWIKPEALNLFGIENLPPNDFVHKSGGDICSRSLINELRKGEKI